MTQNDASILTTTAYYANEGSGLERMVNKSLFFLSGSENDPKGVRYQAGVVIFVFVSEVAGTVRV